ncbi:MAG: YqiA/YcfP family alpha/beta fold hydrolase [Vicinamibacterales bacterium]
MHLFYLHGFASSSRSSKAVFLQEQAAGYGVQVVAPDFNQPDFAGLTISRMVAQVTAAMAAVAPAPVVLIGSSLGGFVAVQVAAREPARVERVVLLAPALDFSANRLRDLGDRALDEWRRTDTLNVFHYGYGRVMPVRYALYEDATQYDAFHAQVPQPVQIFQGRRDVAVDPETVQRWAAARPNVELHLLDDDHQLIASLPSMWREMTRFLGLTAAPTPGASEP